MKKICQKFIVILLSTILIGNNITSTFAANQKSLDTQSQLDELANFDKTLEHSQGWKKVSDHPEDFFDDADRLVRSEDTLQYLIYQCDGLTDFQITMHSYLRNLRYLVNVYGSDDGNNWTAIDYTISSAKTSQSAFWGTFELRPQKLLNGNYQYIKIAVQNNDHADQTKTVKGSDAVNFLDAVQIGKVNFTNDRLGLFTNTNQNINSIKIKNLDKDTASSLTMNEEKKIELDNPTLYDIRIESSNPKVLQYKDGQVKGLTDGQAYLKGIIPGETEVFRYEFKVGSGVNKNTGPTDSQPTADTGNNAYIKQANNDTVKNVVTVDPQNIVVKDYMGGAMELEIIEWFDMDDARWERYFERIQYMDLGFVRCMLAAYWYCTGFDQDNKPIYVWDCLNENGTPKYYSRDGHPIDTLGNNIEPNIKRMKRLYKLFDFFQKNNITVMTGEWQYPEASEWYYVPGEYLKQYDLTIDDARYAKIASGFIEHMVKDKKYTCIEQYDLGNEVNINPTSYQYDKWKKGNLNLYDELKNKGLDKKVSLTPDLSYWLDLWYNESITDLHDIFNQYEFHWYVNEVNLKNGVFENEMRMLVNNAAGQDNKDKKVYMGEVGMRDFLNNSDQVTNIDSFDYGLWMANILVQGTRAGMSGLTAWSLDDAVHINGPMTYDYSVDEKSLMKVWGLWNSLGDYQGVSEDIRPWYVPWALASKFMPKNSQIVYTNPLTEQVYTTAAVHDDDLTISVVNHSGKAQQVLVKIPTASKNVDFSVYAYFKDHLGQDQNGYPVRDGFKKNINLQEGIVLTLPANGNIILTTMEGENKFKSQDDGYLSDSLQSLQNIKDYQNIGFNSYEKHPNKAQNRIDMKQNLFGDVTRVNRASGDKSYLTYQRDNGVKNLRIHGYAKGSVLNNIKVYGSNDNQAWNEISLTETEKYSLSSGWKFAVLVPKDKLSTSYQYIKIELQDQLKSTDIQLGKVEFTNQNQFSQALQLELPSDAQSNEYQKVMVTTQVAKGTQQDIYAIKGFENLPEGIQFKSSDETIVKIEGSSMVALQPGSANVNVYKDDEIIGTVVVNIYAFHDEVKENNQLPDSLHDMKYDNMADANDSTFSRTNDGGYVIYKLTGIHDFVLKGYAADSNDDLFNQIKVYGSKDGNQWESIETKIEGLSALANPYWHYGNIVPKDSITADYDYIKVAIEGSITDHWKIQIGDVCLQDQPFQVLKPSQITIYQETIELSVGETQNLKAKVYPEIVFPFAVDYTSGDSHIATVDENGKITAVSKGTTKIKVAVEDNPDIYQECTVIVKEVEDSSKQIAENIKDLTITDNKVNLPVIEGYTIKIESSSQPHIIALDGTVKPATQDKEVQLVLAVENKLTHVVSYTKSITVKVLHKVDPSKLISLIQKVKYVDESKYTVESYQTLEQALTKAEKLLDKNPTTDDINKAYKELKAALDALELKVDINIRPDEDNTTLTNIDKDIKVIGKLPSNLQLSTQKLNSKELQQLLDKIDKQFLQTVHLEKVYNIDLLHNGKKYKIESPVKIQIQLDKDLADKKLGIIYIDEDGKVQTIKSTVQNGYIEFYTSHLSQYAIVSYQGNNGQVENNQPQTSDEYSVYGYASLALISCLGIYIFLKRRHQVD